MQDRRNKYTNMPHMLFILFYTWYQVRWTIVPRVHKKDASKNVYADHANEGHKRPCSTFEGGCKASILFQVSIYALCRVYSSVWLYAVRVDRLTDETAPSEPVTEANRRSPCRALSCVALHSSVRSVCIRCIQIQSHSTHECSLCLVNLTGYEPKLLRDYHDERDHE